MSGKSAILYWKSNLQKENDKSLKLNFTQNKKTLLQEILWHLFELGHMYLDL